MLGPSSRMVSNVCAHSASGRAGLRRRQCGCAGDPGEPRTLASRLRGAFRPRGRHDPQLGAGPLRARSRGRCPAGRDRAPPRSGRRVPCRRCRTNRRTWIVVWTILKEEAVDGGQPAVSCLRTGSVGPTFAEQDGVVNISRRRDRRWSLLAVALRDDDLIALRCDRDQLLLGRDSSAISRARAGSPSVVLFPGRSCLPAEWPSGYSGSSVLY